MSKRVTKNAAITEMKRNLTIAVGMRTYMQYNAEHSDVLRDLSLKSNSAIRREYYHGKVSALSEYLILMGVSQNEIDDLVDAAYWEEMTHCEYLHDQHKLLEELTK